MPRKDPEKMARLNRMTNWQLTQWQRAGRPGLDAKGHVADEAELQRFIDLAKRRV